MPAFRLLFLFPLFLMLLPGCRKAPETGAKPPPRALPVLVAKAERRATPLSLPAIGRIVAPATVSIKPQITGQISEVHFEEGQEVKKGNLLFTIDARPFEAALHRAEAAQDEARANLRNAERQAQRYQELSKRGAVAKEQADQIKLNLETSQAALASAEAAVRTAELQVEYCSIRAPLTGRTGRRLVDPGNVVTANGTDLVVIHQMEPIHVAFSMAERHLPELKHHLANGGIVARVTPEGNAQPTAEGPVQFLDNNVKPGSGTIELKATLPNTDRRLWPGQFVEVEALLGIEEDALVIPAGAIQTGQKGDYVFVIRPDQTAEYRPVTLSRIARGVAVIGKGLEPGETVAVDGQSLLTDGTPVSIKESLTTARHP